MTNRQGEALMIAGCGLAVRVPLRQVMADQARVLGLTRTQAEVVAWVVTLYLASTKLLA